MDQLTTQSRHRPQRAGVLEIASAFVAIAGVPALFYPPLGAALGSTALVVGLIARWRRRAAGAAMGDLLQVALVMSITEAAISVGIMAIIVILILIGGLLSSIP